ncbi:hypothetical protein B9Z55_004409 [Caenorhabditis nigoni]|nr:hypothetical protein B9Z55_004409 [Caenorhabditis nigoni]
MSYSTWDFSNFSRILRSTRNAFFPEIQKRKNGEFLRTCDLFEAIEHCQLIGFLEKFPIFAVFMHSQKACHMIMGLQCVECNENWHDEFEIEEVNEKNVISFGKINIKKEKDEENDVIEPESQLIST